MTCYNCQKKILGYYEIIKYGIGAIKLCGICFDEENKINDDRAESRRRKEKTSE